VYCTAYFVGDIPPHLLLIHFSPLLSNITVTVTVTAGINYYRCNVLYSTVLYCTILYRPKHRYHYITLNEKICLQEKNRQTDKQTDRHGIRTLRPLYPHPNLPTNTYQAENSSKTEATLSPVVCGSSGNAGQH